MEKYNINKKIYKSKEVVYLTFPLLEQFSFIVHGFSTRYGGVSSGIYQSMNFAFNSHDKKENVQENYRIFSEILGIDCNNMVLSAQEHGTNIKIVKKDDKGKGIKVPKDYNNIDGLATNISNIHLVAFFADCVPLFFADPSRQVVGIAHSGWKGTAGKIAENMVNVLCQAYKSKLSDIFVAIGPSIGPCCYEVGEEVAAFFSENVKKCKDDGKYIIDLWQANKNILTNAGIPETNIVCSELCTMCNKDMFFSHRGHKGRRGTMIGVIGIKGENQTILRE